MNTVEHKSRWQRFGLVVLTFSVLVSVGFLSAPRSVEAQDAVVVVGGSGTIADIKTALETAKTAIEQTIDTASTLVIETVQKSLFDKEWTQDGIAWGLAKAVLRQITQSFVDWINSGFEGDPAFITDLEGHLLDALDEVAGEFIYGSELGFLCSPYQLDVRIALALQHQKTKGFEEARCTLTGVVDNLENFFAGDFAQGGWTRWFEITGHPENNPYGAYLLADTELEGRLRIRERNTRDEALWGDGFLSYKHCVSVEGSSDDLTPEEFAERGTGEAKKKCTIVTPGQLISDHLEFEVSVGERVLIEADEVNEIISALFAQLGKQAITGTNGLLGLARNNFNDSNYNFDLGSNGSGRDTYLGRLGNDSFNAPNNPLSTSAGFLRLAFENELSYIAEYSSVVNAVNGLESLIASGPSCSGVPTSISSASQQARTDAQREVNESTGLISVLDSYETRYDNAATVEEQLQIFEEFQRVEPSLPFHSPRDISEAVIANEPILEEIRAERQTILDAQSGC